MPSSAYAICHDATEAYMELSESPNEYCTIVLGQHFAQQAGEPLLTKIQHLNQLKIVPIVVVADNASYAWVEALIHEGARYFIPTQMNPETAQKMILTAIEDFQRYHQATTSVEHGIHAATSLVNAEFCIRTLDEAQALANFLAEATPNPRMSVVGLSEIFINAIEHGNLGISYEEKTDLHGQDGWLEEVNRRLGLAENLNKEVQIFYKKSNKHIKLRVIDQGQGFDWQQYQDLDKNRALDTHGRGIIMAKSLSFDKLEYIGNGNEVECVIYLTPD